MKIVLLADHHPRQRAEASELLRRHGCSVIGVHDAADLIETFAAHHDDIALAIVDAELPPTGGLAALRRLESLNPDVPLYLMLETGAVAAAHSAEETVNVSVLRTPLEPDQIAAALASLLLGDLSGNTGHSNPGDPGDHSNQGDGDVSWESPSATTSPSPSAYPARSAPPTPAPSAPLMASKPSLVLPVTREDARAFQWPPAADTLAAIEVVDARTLQPITIEPAAMTRFVAAPRGRPGPKGLKRGRRLARATVRLRRSASPIGTLAATCACVGLLTYVEVRPEQQRADRLMHTRQAQAEQQARAAAPNGPGGQPGSHLPAGRPGASGTPGPQQALPATIPATVADGGHDTPATRTASLAPSQTSRPDATTTGQSRLSDMKGDPVPGRGRTPSSTRASRDADARDARTEPRVRMQHASLDTTRALDSDGTVTDGPRAGSLSARSKARDTRAGSQAARETRGPRPMRGISMSNVLRKSRSVAKPFTSMWEALRPKPVASRDQEGGL